MIIDTSYFQQRPLFVPNTVIQPTLGTNTPSGVAQLQQAIDGMEYQLLFDALGSAQYIELMAQFNPNGTFIPNPIQKWVDLVNGKNQWKGLRQVNGTSKVSLIAYYVYYNFLYNDAFYYASTGLVKSDDANSTNIDSTWQLVTQWNNFIEMYQGGGNCFLNYYNPIFFEWNGYPYSEDKSQTSLLSFLQSDTVAYSTEFFKRYQLQNRLGL